MSLLVFVFLFFQLSFLINVWTPKTLKQSWHVFDPLTWPWAQTCINSSFSTFGRESESWFSLQSRTEEEFRKVGVMKKWWCFGWMPGKSSRVLSDSILISVVISVVSCSSGIVDFGSVSAHRRDTTSGPFKWEMIMSHTWVWAKITKRLWRNPELLRDEVALANVRYY